MMLSIVFGLVLFLISLVSAAPPSSTVPSDKHEAKEANKCLELTYPSNGTVWDTYGTYDVTWTVTGECQDINYVYLLPVSQDEDGEVVFGELYHMEEALDIDSGHFPLNLDSREVEGNYVFAVGPKVDDWSDYSDFAVISIA
ncbi:hypothetical protein J3Q64DRAFT_1763789 [Phycomyces blakesleeanus]|uniref:Secreted protein n=2 Tax=Phycomyces blakesleeanus TaxID=4837 RepID=A0A167KM30_PHYB8|nr:hypothetical protein PHYBLDRAFT_68964 [Phycomyces blakesleeanus NRRL 1555(-)]OAD68407.1 hypothetical protein PHYBLDRAFT_68964 [Phycomyces blakesleeanus NRRL 1555(-)]|eukprot:XP_018286447.1 hypothetical protein PHYBLDRAFT_68964 [Phycomyces blakesleeanus NRRL 1555(-)]